MRKEILVLGAVMLALPAAAQVAVDNGAFQTQANGGPSNAPRSTLQNLTLLLQNFGFGCQKVNQNRVADNFVVPAGARLRLTGFRFYGYQGTATGNTINDVNMRVWNGAPNAGGTVIAGDPTTNLFASGTSTGVYRVDDNGGQTFSNRLIMEIRANFTLAPVLVAGTYWADWQMQGTLPSGPFAVPVTILGQTAKPGANGLQFLSSLNAWGPATDPSGPVQDHAFKAIGSWIVNPSSFNVGSGFFAGGNLASLANSDNVRLAIAMDAGNSVSELNMSATSPSSTASQLSVKVELRASRSDLAQLIELQNTSNAYEEIDQSISTLADSIRTTIITVNAGRFIRPANAIVSRITTIPTQDLLSLDGWTASTDQVEFEITP